MRSSIRARVSRIVASAVGVAVLGVSGAAEASAATGPTLGGVYVRYGLPVALNQTSSIQPVLAGGQFNPGSFLVTFSASVDTLGAANPENDVTCRIVFDRGNGLRSTPFARFPAGTYRTFSATVAITTTQRGGISVRCGASHLGNPIPGQISMEETQLLVQWVKRVTQHYVPVR